MPTVGLISETSALPYSEVERVASALSVQVSRDLASIWVAGKQSRVLPFQSRDAAIAAKAWPVVVSDDIGDAQAAGFHTDDNGAPYSLVEYSTEWATTASHETLEMLADPTGSRLYSAAPPAQAPEPLSLLRKVFYLVELCDPCEEQTYTIDAVTVSDFITGHFYDFAVKPKTRYSFTRSIPTPRTILDGGYVSFQNPKDKHWYQLVVLNGNIQLTDLGIIEHSGSVREGIRLVGGRL